MLGQRTAGAGSHHHPTTTTPNLRPSSPLARDRISPSASHESGILTRSHSALQLLQQQRREARSNVASASAPQQRLSRTTSKRTSPTTSRKKIKAKASVPAANAEAEVKGKDDDVGEESVVDAETTSSEAPEEKTIMLEGKKETSEEPIAEATEEQDEEESDEMDAEGEDDVSVSTVTTPLTSASSKSAVSEIDNDEQDQAGPSQQNVVVCVRVRSVTEAEDKAMWKMDGEKSRIMPTDQHPTMVKRNTTTTASGESNTVAEDGAYDFSFDSLITPEQSAESMYTKRIAPVVGAVAKGYNGTVFAYGQTGSGKTFTMSGDGGTERGVIPRAVEQIFHDVEKTSSREFLLRVSYLEIYNETLNDLLGALPSSTAQSASDPDGRPSSPTKGGSSHMVAGNSGTSTSLRMFESGGRVQIQGLREEIVTTPAEVLDLLERGQKARHQAATDWNERSSRSHCVFMLTVESREKLKDGTKRSGDSNVRLSQLNLIDLAGSERAASEKERRKEGAFINKSLLTLGTVIAKLSEQSASGREEAHIPYRDSKLTRLLQTSLGGNARVAVVCTLSPRKEHAVEGLSTLRFGQRCKMVVTRAKQGSIVDDKALIARYKRELDKLRSQLEAGASVSTPAVVINPRDDPSIKALQDEKAKAERDVRDMSAQRSALKQQIEHLTRLILTGKDVEANQGKAVVVEEEEDEFDRVRRRRAARRSDMGTSSPSKHHVARFDSPNILTPKRGGNNQENVSLFATPKGGAKPFAMESELAQLRKSLNKALTAKQASEEARRKEVQLWQAKVGELEEANKEQEEELDEAEEAFNKLKADRDAMRAQVNDEREANRLLKLVAKSRTADLTEEQRRALLGESETRITALKRELDGVRAAQAKRDTEMHTLREELRVAKAASAAGQTTTGEQTALQERIVALERELDESRAQQQGNGAENHSFATADEGEVVTTLRDQLRDANEENERLVKELRQAALEYGQEDAERDFADLVKGETSSSSSSMDTLRKALTQAKRQLAERERENEEQRATIDELNKRKSKALPVPSLSSPLSTPSLTETARSTLERQLKRMEERCKLLEIQVDTHKREALAATFKANSANPSPPLSSSSPTMRSPPQQMAELQMENDVQKSQIASLERQLAEARSNDNDSSTMLKAGPFRASFASRLSRGGSMREYKRYSGADSGVGGDIASPTRSNDDIARAVKAEREEIERLNEVISSQRTLMVDLEASVATWKKRLRLQQDIIAKLVESGVKASPSLLAQSQTIATADTPAMAQIAAKTVDLKRTSSVASTASSSASPYYGAHIYNRPPAPLGATAHGLGLGSTSPTKGSGWLATMPGHRPDYAISAGLSSPQGKSSSSTSRRKTIEHEIQSLRGSPRIESTKSRLLEPQMRSPAGVSTSRGPLPAVPGSPSKSRPVKDWYI